MAIRRATKTAPAVTAQKTRRRAARVDDKLKPTPPAPPDEPTADPFDDPVVAQLTGDILQHHGAANSKSVEVRAEVGRLLLDVRARLPHGSFGTYLSEHVPFNPSTAERAANLHRFRVKQPALFDQIARAGLSHAYVLIKLPVPKIEALVNQSHTVPSTGVNKTLLAMGFDEMMELVAGARPAKNPAKARLHEYKRAARRLIRALDDMVDKDEHVDPDDLGDIHEELDLTLDRFIATFAPTTP